MSTSNRPEPTPSLNALRQEFDRFPAADSEQRARMIQADQARRWRAGQGLLVEEYLGSIPGLADEPSLVVDLVLGEILLRREGGVAVDPAEYLRRLPAFAEVLAPHLELDRALGGPEGLPVPTSGTATEAAAIADYRPGQSGSSVATAGAGEPGLPPGQALRYFGDYEILGELGRGGMGVVYRARQVSLNRPVALKMIKAGLLAGGDELRRFQNEVEAVALLDHPAIVPVYEVGEHEGQHFFSMKLVEGGSLVPLLPRYTDDPRASALLVAEAAEAMAHAHARGILHRDLKPANILVDSEGHPHVTDFGLAKRLEADLEMTASGAILGTPAYMAPEQAEGRRGSITTATDVYGLGSLLYALLTGRAPFGGDSVVQTLDAVRQHPPEPPTRLNARVPRDLETICLKCLEKDPRRRYPTAQALADDLRRWLDRRPIQARPVGVAERAWLWCRRRPAAAALYASIALTVALGAGAGTLELRRRAAFVGRAERALAEASRRLEAARAGGDDLAAWQAAAASLDALGPVLANAGDRDLAARRDGIASAIRGGLALAERETTLFRSLEDARANAKEVGQARTISAYRRALREAGLAVERATPAEVRAWLGSRSPERNAELATFLDHWLLQERATEEDAARVAALGELVALADPDPFRRRVRAAVADPKVEARPATLLDLARSLGSSPGETRSATLLAGALIRVGEVRAAVELLRRAVLANPGDFWATLELARALRRVPDGETESLRYFTAARAMRPEYLADMPHVLEGLGRFDEAEAIYKTLLRLRPDRPSPRVCYGRMLLTVGRKGEAREQLELAIHELSRVVSERPDDAYSLFELGNAHFSLGQHADAAGVYRRVLAVDRTDSFAYFNYAEAMRAMGRADEAMRAYRKSLEIDPNQPEPHFNMASLLREFGRLDASVRELREAVRLDPSFAGAFGNLALTLLDMGQVEEAVDPAREAARLDPKSPRFHCDLGLIYQRLERHAEALAEFDRAIELAPDTGLLYYNRGISLDELGREDEAVNDFLRACEMEPEDAEARYNLANLLRGLGRIDEAIQAFREAIRLRPDLAEAHCNLGNLLRDLGRYDEAVESLRRGHDLGSSRPGWPYESAEWLARAERLAELSRRVPALLDGSSDAPFDPVDLYDLSLPILGQGRYATAARLCRIALAADPSLAEERGPMRPYNAATAAVQAAFGHGPDAPSAGDPERDKLRRQALEWLRGEIPSWIDHLAGADAREYTSVAHTLRHCQTDPLLAPVREPASLATLPATERAEWEAFWTDLARLIDRVHAGPSAEASLTLPEPLFAPPV